MEFTRPTTEQQTDYVLDPWLSARLSKATYRLEMNDDVLPPLPAERPLFVYTKVPVYRTHYIKKLEEASFHLFDTNIQFLGVPVGVKASHYKIVDASSKTRQGVLALASSQFIYSRFHMDPAIDFGDANGIKRAWVDNFFQGERGDNLYVALDADKPVGFVLTLHRKGELVIDLYAVLERYRMRSIGQSLLLHAWENRPPECVRMRLGTQAVNASSARLCERIGLRFASAEYIFHLHCS